LLPLTLAHQPIPALAAQNERGDQQQADDNNHGDNITDYPEVSGGLNIPEFDLDPFSLQLV
jgi:hypothetical protein